MQLAEFQDAFAQALLAPQPQATQGATQGAPPLDPGHAVLPALAALVAQPGFAVYRNTVFKGCVDAIEANYPAVTRLVGSQWLRAAATVYARGQLPRHPTLLDYGADFADFLAAFAPAAELPYLAGVAQLDRLWNEAHVAADAPVLAAHAVACLQPDQMARVGLVPHPAARWRWFDRDPIYTIWSRNRAAAAHAADDDGELSWQGEGALVTRPVGAVEHGALARGGVALLDMCAAGASIAVAARAAHATTPQTDLAALMRDLLLAGAFSALHSTPTGESCQ